MDNENKREINPKICLYVFLIFIAIITAFFIRSKMPYKSSNLSSSKKSSYVLKPENILCSLDGNKYSEYHYKNMIDILQTRCINTRMDISDIVVTTQKIIKKNKNVDESLLAILLGLELSTRGMEGQNLDLANIAVGYAAIY